ncbi:MAG: hypothetical protein ABR555_08295 [Pyrinomonadaceae bacterium]
MVRSGVDAANARIVAERDRWVKQESCLDLFSGKGIEILSLAVSRKLNNQNRDAGEQENVDETAVM